MISEKLVRGAHDYRWLLDRGYPENGSIALVGDRHRLSRDERHMLYRGISSRDAADRRLRRLRGAEALPAQEAAQNDAPSPERAPPIRTVRGITARTDGILGIDGHNVLLTIANYVTGIPTFECDDGLVRDIGGVHGRVKDERLMERAIELAAGTLTTAMIGDGAAVEGTEAGGRVVVFLDAPVSHSKDHACRFRSALEERSVVCEVETVRSADAALTAAKLGCLATSDSALIDATTIPVFDLARAVIESHFSPEFPSFRMIPLHLSPFSR